MSGEKEWKTTKRADGPTGRKVAHTFRDVSMIHYIPEFIDDMDHVCMELGLKRSEVWAELENQGTIEPLDLLPKLQGT